MLLGLSSAHHDGTVTFDAVSGSEHGDGGVEHGELLARLCEAIAAGDDADLAAARDEVTALMGGDALVDAVAVNANFHMMTRIADGTGTPLDAFTVEPSEALRETIGLNDLVSRRHVDQ